MRVWLHEARSSERLADGRIVESRENAAHAEREPRERRRLHVIARARRERERVSPRCELVDLEAPGRIDDPVLRCPGTRWCRC